MTRLCSGKYAVPYSNTDAGPASVLEQDLHAGGHAESRVGLRSLFFITRVALPNTAGDSRRRDLNSHLLHH